MGYNRVRAAAALLLIVLAWAFGAGTAFGIFPIPSGPGVLLVPRYEGAPATANPVESFEVPQHPHLAPNGANSMHNDAYTTDAYDRPGPLGREPKVTTASYGVSECATVAFDRAGDLVGLCGDLLGPQLKLIDPDTLDERATHRLPERQLRAGSSPLSDLCGGAYFYLDDADRAVIATTDRHIHVVSHTPAEFKLERAYDLTAAIPAEDCLIALMPDWGGRIWFETGEGTVGTVDPDSGQVATRTLPGETIANSFAVDETGGVFIVSDHALYRFDAEPGTGTPQVTWRRPYDRGSRQKPGQLSQGSGTTPTLIGPDLVAITDNADPRMNVRVYERGRDGAPVCHTPVFEPGTGATENSLVAAGNALFVENNYGYEGPQTTLLGNTTAGGIARVDVDADAGACTVAWTNPLSAPTSVPKASLPSGLLYAYTKPAHALVDAWYFTAIDLRTGKTAFKRLAGTGPLFNNHYAAIYLGDGGAAYLATLAGMVKVQDGG